MEFKAMAEAMGGKEAALILHLAEPFSRAEKIIRNYESNSIYVHYSILREQNKMQHQINFLPDDIYLVPDDDLSDEIRMEEGEVLYKYRQFMIAKGYSEMWLNNPYVEL
ncbi:MAG: hypothetical protein HFH15_08560 [Ruminococcus sp.]|jgi:hypothetical protein|nr:hypothetical protein [Ruminococcus sp.]